MLSTTGLENQLMEVMARLDAVEKDLHTEKVEHKNECRRTFTICFFERYPVEKARVILQNANLKSIKVDFIDIICIQKYNKSK